MILRVLQQAEWEARDAACWYDEQQQGLGDAFVDEYQSALEKIEDRPESYARLETVDTPKDIRRFVLRRFPYKAVFELAGDEIIVLAVPHVGRRPNYWIDRMDR